jgi:hypothetical protein
MCMKIEALFENEDHKQYLRSLGYRVDNPGGEWLENAIDRYGRPAYPRAASGKNTATIGIFKPVEVNVSYFIKFRGELGEENWRHTSTKREALARSVEENGWNEEDAHIMVFVAYNGTPTIGEGNHRLAYAFDHGIEWIRADIRYFNGGERPDGPLNPKDLSPKIIRPLSQ